MNRRIFQVGGQVAWLLALAACGAEAPPMTHVVDRDAVTSRATRIVFVWAPDSCESGGYYVLTTSDGRFLGNVSRATRLEVPLAAGSYDIFAWNPPVEAEGRPLLPRNVAVFHADVAEGHTYFVRLGFGEWDDHGPRSHYRGRRGTLMSTRACLGSDAMLLPVHPGSEEWSDIGAWLDLTPLASDSSGQAWLDGQRASWAAHKEIATARFDAMPPDAKKLATLGPDDAVQVRLEKGP